MIYINYQQREKFLSWWHELMKMFNYIITLPMLKSWIMITEKKKSQKLPYSRHFTQCLSSFGLVIMNFLRTFFFSWLGILKICQKVNEKTFNKGNKVSRTSIHPIAFCTTCTQFRTEFHEFSRKNFSSIFIIMLKISQKVNV